MKSIKVAEDFAWWDHPSISALDDDSMPGETLEQVDILLEVHGLQVVWYDMGTGQPVFSIEKITK